jgi:hypothetical protein
MIGSMVLPGIGSVVGCIIGGVSSGIVVSSLTIKAI